MYNKKGYRGGSPKNILPKSYIIAKAIQPAVYDMRLRR